MIVLDTHVVVWMAARPDRLSRSAKRAIERETRTAGLMVASVTLMELAQLAARGEIRIPNTPNAWLRQLLAEGGLTVCELNADVASIAAFLPRDFPADPFDRIIAATAISDHMALVTADERIRESGVVRTIW